VAGTGAAATGVIPDVRGLSHALTYQSVIK